MGAEAVVCVVGKRFLAWAGDFGVLLGHSCALWGPLRRSRGWLRSELERGAPLVTWLRATGGPEEGAHLGLFLVMDTRRAALFPTTLMRRFVRQASLR